MRILFVGGDARMKYTAERLSEKHEITWYGNDGAFAPEKPYDILMLPLPLTKDGKTVFAPDEQDPITFERLSGSAAGFADEQTLVLAGGEAPALNEFCAKTGCKAVNYFADETLTLQNAALTAEAALCLLSQSGGNALLGSKVVITGSGRIAFFLAQRLRACGAKVTFAARNKDKRALAELNGYKAVPLETLPELLPKTDFTANTIPAPLFDDDAFSKMRVNSVYQELATLPQQPQKALAERYGIKYIFAGGLPGKYYPKTAGDFIAHAAEELIRKFKNIS